VGGGEKGPVAIRPPIARLTLEAVGVLIFDHHALVSSRLINQLDSGLQCLVLYLNSHNKDLPTVLVIEAENSLGLSRLESGSISSPNLLYVS
jgi:hypothetical protein